MSAVLIMKNGCRLFTMKAGVVHGGGGQCLGRGRNAFRLFTMTAGMVANF